MPSPAEDARIAEALADAALLGAYYDCEPGAYPEGEAAFLADIRRDYPEHVDTAEAVARRVLLALAALRRPDGGRSDRSEVGDLRGPLLAKAREQVAYWRERQRREKSFEDGVSEDGETYTSIGDEAAWRAGYCNGWQGSSAWWLSTIEHLPAPSHETIVAEMERRIEAAHADLARVFPPTPVPQQQTEGMATRPDPARPGGEDA